jgi:hypothetical protein
MVLLKLVMPVVLEETVNVNVAAVDCPAERTIPSLFQFNARYVLATPGLHALVVMLSAIEPVPEFLR